MSTSNDAQPSLDVFIIGGGINGCAIARDLAGRGLKIALCEKDDFASHTSSASTKLFHGGLRYLEYFKFKLVREALIEREILLKNMPHISHPMRFILPLNDKMRFEGDTPTSKLLSFFMPWLKGKRPNWLIYLGLMIYDRLGGRKILPSTSKVDLTDFDHSHILKPHLTQAYEYSDCWVDDARLTVLNAVDAKNRGAHIQNYQKVVAAKRVGDLWQIDTISTMGGEPQQFFAKFLINASGPWVSQIMNEQIKGAAKASIRLVKGSHIILPKIYHRDEAFFFQGEDGRIIFAIPYEEDFTLIGTTDETHQDADIAPQCSVDEQEYLVQFANQYFAKELNVDDIIASYSGVRPLYDDGAKSAKSATRDYVLKLHEEGAPLLNIYGGKITTHRRLAEKAFSKIAHHFPNAKSNWTEIAALPGGDFNHQEVDYLIDKAMTDYPFMDQAWAKRMIKAYGTLLWDMLGNASEKASLGEIFGANLSEVELCWLHQNEFAKTIDDILKRRSKLYLHMDQAEQEKLAIWIAKNWEK